MNGWFHVFWHALTLDSTFYAQAPQQPKMKRKAQVFVGIAALSHAVGSSMILLTYQTSLVLQGLAFVVNALSIVGGYYLWTFTIEKVADWLHVQIPSYKPFLILIGLTYAPQVFNIFTVVPLLGRPIEVGLALWSLVAAIAALHYGLKLKLTQAIAISTLGWVAVQIAVGTLQLVVQALLD
ncbi:MAG: hypothetical protein LRZ84_15025 [Desertifilum sp.]|nr:hypothetical protein [Desertifilum sp.]